MNERKENMNERILYFNLSEIDLEILDMFNKLRDDVKYDVIVSGLEYIDEYYNTNDIKKIWGNDVYEIYKAYKQNYSHKFEEDN